VRLGTATILKLLGEVDGAVKVQAAIIIEVNIQSPVISRCVYDTNFACLHKVIGDRNVLLIRGNFDIVRANRVLVLIGVIQTLNVTKVADVKRSDMVCRG
jgi:hypothetical protein